MSDWRETGRWALVTVALAAMLAGLGVRLALLHFGPNDDLLERISRIRTLEYRIPARRGRIVDRHGSTLAMNIAMRDVWVDPTAIMGRDLVPFVARQLVRQLDVEYDEVMDRLTREGRRYEPIRRFVDNDTAARLASLRLPGVHFDEVYRRSYPHGLLMAHVVGFANMEGVGSAGVEQSHDRNLRGTPGWRVSERDGRRREIYGRRRLDISPRAGADIVLTLDLHIQHMVETALDRAVEEHRPLAAWVIVQHVPSGAILAMASRPVFDPNAYGSAGEQAWRNRCVGYNFEPGSTFKAAVIAAALEAGVVTPEDRFDCEKGRWHYAGRPLRDFSPHDVLSVADIVKKSSNIGAAKIALLLGEERLEESLRAFGFGRPSGIDLPGEEGGILHPRRSWTALSITRIAMGHEVAVTALQMLNAVCAIANGGALMRPFLVAQVEAGPDRVIYRARPEKIAQPLSPETAATMRGLLTRATEPGGTGRRAALPDLQVAGKTGTSQKIVDGRYTSSAHIASFVGFLPAEHPEVGMMVVFDEPRSGAFTGGAVAAPLFAEIADQVMRYLVSRPYEEEAWLGGLHAARY